MNFIQLETVFQRLLRIPDKYTSFNFFKQENLNRQFVNSGFVVVDLPDLDVVIELYQASLGLDKEGADGNQDTGFQNTSFLDNQEKRSKVQSVLLSFSSQLFSTFLNPELQIEAGSFFTKKAKSPSDTKMLSPVRRVSWKEVSASTYCCVYSHECAVALQSTFII